MLLLSEGRSSICRSSTSDNLAVFMLGLECAAVISIRENCSMVQEHCSLDLVLICCFV